MTRRWSRATRDALCGGCGSRLTRGTVVQLIHIPRISGEKVRCAGCADGEPPLDLPPLVVEQPPAPVPLARMAAQVARDWKLRAIGEREPGDDD